MDDVMVGIVTNGPLLPSRVELIRELRTSVPEVMSIVQNINTDPGNVILGEKTATLFGTDTLREVICGVEFDISLNSFMQVNHEGMELLYTTVMKAARLMPHDVVVDLYCGAGTISLIAAKLCGRVYGIAR